MPGTDPPLALENRPRIHRLNCLTLGSSLLDSRLTFERPEAIAEGAGRAAPVCGFGLLKA
jgi:hypothetical protein